MIIIPCLFPTLEDFENENTLTNLGIDFEASLEDGIEINVYFQSIDHFYPFVEDGFKYVQINSGNKDFTTRLTVNQILNLIKSDGK